MPLYEYGADLVLNGHAHWYERFAPQTPDGVADPTYGIPQITVGTGGKVLRGLGTIDPNSEVRDWSTWGVLKLTLNQSSYDWEFVPVAGSSFTDSGSMDVHQHGRHPNTPPDALDDAYSTPRTRRSTSRPRGSWATTAMSTAIPSARSSTRTSATAR